MIIDLHCHTQATKGEGNERNIKPKEMISVLEEKGVEIFSITNHNLFDFEEYKIANQKAYSKGIQCYPGVEIDVIGLEGERAHVVLIVNPEKAEDLEGLYGTGRIECTKSYEIPILNLLNDISELDYILMLHYFKEPQLSNESIEFLRKEIEDYRLFLEPSNFRSLSIISNKGYRCLFGSDIKNWKNYLKKENELPELKLRVSSFREFILLSKRDKQMVDTLLNKTKKKSVELEIVIKGKQETRRKETIDLYQDLNVIFGGKGSGKSEYLRFIDVALRENGYQTVYYDSEDSSNVIGKYIEVNDEEFDIKNICSSATNESFDEIINYDPPTLTNITEYFEAIKTNQNKRNRKYIGLVDHTEISNDASKRKPVLETRYNTIKDFSEWYNSDELGYLKDDDDKVFKILLEKMSVKAKLDYKENWVESEATRLINLSIEVIKRETDIHTNGVSLPNKAGLEDYFFETIEPYSNLCYFVKTMNLEAKEESKNFGKVDIDKQIFVNTTYKIFDNNESSKIYKLNVGMTKSDLKKMQKLMVSAKKSFLTADYSANILKIQEFLKISNVTSINNFVTIHKRFITGEIDPYELSSGEEKVIAFQKVIETEADFYLLDEPERSLGSLYTTVAILPQLQRLHKSNKYVVCTTHSANIAVLGMPFQTILKEYDNKNYSTFSGNLFSNKLFYVLDEKKTLEWDKKSIELLEGGEFAFLERGYTYGVN